MVPHEPRQSLESGSPDRWLTIQGDQRATTGAPQTQTSEVDESGDVAPVVRVDQDDSSLVPLGQIGNTQQLERFPALHIP